MVYFLYELITHDFKFVTINLYILINRFRHTELFVTIFAWIRFFTRMNPLMLYHSFFQSKFLATVGTGVKLFTGMNHVPSTGFIFSWIDSLCCFKEYSCKEAGLTHITLEGFIFSWTDSACLPHTLISLINVEGGNTCQLLS